MTKIKNKNQIKIMHSHYDDAFKLINEHLHPRYVKDVQKKIGNTYTSGTIRNLRNKVNPVNNSNVKILLALVELANENKNQKIAIAKITN